jgi:hypothetical protein
MAYTIDVLLERSALTIEDVAELSRLSVDRVEAIVHGRWLASPRERQKLADVFGIAVADIDWGHFMNPRNVRYHRFGLEGDFQKRREESDHTDAS